MGIDFEKTFKDMMAFNHSFTAESKYNALLFAYAISGGASALLTRLLDDEGLPLSDEVKDHFERLRDSNISNSIEKYLKMKDLKKEKNKTN